MSECACGEDWRVEVCDLASGRVRGVLHPLSMDWQTVLNQVGRGSLTLATREVSIRHIWPGLTSVYIMRTSGTGASHESPVAEYAGIIEEIGASDSGTTVVGLQSIESYAWSRTIRGTRTYSGTRQTHLAADLINICQSNGIPLIGVGSDTAILRDRTYEYFTRKVVGEAVEDLTRVINGPDWELVHERLDGHWRTRMIFRDSVGVDRDLTIASDREASAYSLSVTKEDIATLVDAIGEGMDEDTLIATASDSSGIYPQFDVAPAWKDVTVQQTLQEHADGYLEEHREPDARPTVTISGMTPDPSVLRNGDVINLDISFGAISFRGAARILSISWSLTPESPLTRTLEFWPLGRASQTVLNQQATDPDCRDC